MKIKDLIKAARECTDLTELVAVIEEDFDLEIDAVNYIDEAAFKNSNIINYASRFCGYFHGTYL